MKKILFTIVSIAAVVAACKPVEVRDNIGGNITVDELRAQSTVTIWTDGGQTVNYVTCDTKAPVNAVWSSVTQFQGAHCDLQLFATGEQTVKLQGLCADGTVVETEFKVNVDKIKYEIHPWWGLLTNGSEKSWTWDTSRPNASGMCWCWGGYNADTAEGIADGAGQWWGATPAEVTGRCAGRDADGEGATMKFVLQGTQIVKSCGSTGKFSFTEGETAHNIGKLQATGAGILFPYINVDDALPEQYTSTFEILRLTEDKLDLCAATDGTGDWGRSTVWHFKAAN